jgi:hypothetical protein
MALNLHQLGLQLRVLTLDLPLLGDVEGDRHDPDDGAALVAAGMEPRLDFAAGLFDRHENLLAGHRPLDIADPPGKHDLCVGSEEILLAAADLGEVATQGRREAEGAVDGEEADRRPLDDRPESLLGRPKLFALRLDLLTREHERRHLDPVKEDAVNVPGGVSGGRDGNVEVREVAVGAFVESQAELAQVDRLSGRVDPFEHGARAGILLGCQPECPSDRIEVEPRESAIRLVCVLVDEMRATQQRNGRGGVSERTQHTVPRGPFQLRVRTARRLCRCAHRSPSSIRARKRVPRFQRMSPSFLER